MQILFGLLVLFISFSSFAIHEDEITITAIIDHQNVRVKSTKPNLILGENLLVVSKDPDIGVIGFLVVKEKISTQPVPTYVCELNKQSQYHLIQIGDRVIQAKLNEKQRQYRGSTELLIKQNTKQDISLRYRPLFTQGIQIGETAQTLWQLETFVTWYGLVHFGISDRWTIGTLVPANFFNIYNFSTKFKIYDSNYNTVSSGMSFTKPKDSERWTANLTLMWDSFSSSSTVTHTFATLAVFSIEKAEDSTAIKAAGTSSLQTGYEFILPNWDRILLGPNYNFETKNIGGYLAYKMIWDVFALEWSLYSTNIQNVKMQAENGYSFFFDAYWRF